MALAQLTGRTEGGFDPMWRNTDDVWEEGLKRGRKLGYTGVLAEVFAEGFVMGYSEGRTETILALLRNNTEDALLHDAIFSGLKITQQEIDDAKRSLRS